ncbi:MAG: hypothetical protein WC455_13715 [Dehalococcoidia bacterium]|jgi:hypothetical protein
MGMTSGVEGFRPPNAEWKKMKAVYDSCEKAGIEIPDEVSKFFDDETPDENGQTVDLGDAVSEWSDGDMSEGIEVDLTKLPKGLTIIRFHNSW